MPLDTQVKGDPNTLTNTCRYLRARAELTDNAGHRLQSASSGSESGWTSQAGDALRGLLAQVGQMNHTVDQSLADSCTALETHADDLRTVGNRMQDARDVAHRGGLTVNGFTIEEPGPAPAPAQRPVATGPMTPQQRESYNADLAAQDAYEQKAKAYAQAAQIVKDARKYESDSQNKLVNFISGALDPVKLGLTIGDMATGAAAAVATRTSALGQVADDAFAKATSASKTMMSSSSSFAKQLDASITFAHNKVVAKESLEAIEANRANRIISKMPQKAQKAIAALDTKLVPKGVPKSGSWILRGGRAVGSKIPGAGLLFTAGGVTYDISQGKDPTQAIVSGAAGLGAGTAAGMAIGTVCGGPIGTVAGGLIGMGVGWGVDQLWPD